MDTNNPPKYRLWQLGAPDQNGVQRNVAFASLDDLVTHHPLANRFATVRNGTLANVENPWKRTYALVGGETQEVEATRTDEYHVVREHQVLLVKDFILEHSAIPPGGSGVRDVDVPTPLAGYVGRVDAKNGVVDVLDQAGGQVILRARHLEPIHVDVGDQIQYGQSLGTQNRKGLSPLLGKHAHMEIDTRYYQQFGHYIEDLASGRLGIDPKRRVAGIEPRAVVDDGIVRIGQSGETVRLVQQRLNGLGYRDADGQTLEEDGTYRLSMQAAVIRYQQAEGLPVSGDIDRALQRNLIPQIFPPSLRDEDGTRSSPELPFVRSNAPDSAHQIQSEPLLDQARRHAASLDLPDLQPAASERFAARMACLAHQSGLTAIDHIVLSRESGAVRSGEYVFVVQGALQDPMHMRARMRTDDAMNAPLAESIQALARDNRRDIVDITQDVPQRQAPTQSRV